MPTPPKGDPNRPLELAANAARTLGVVSILLGLFAGCGTLAIGGRGSVTILLPALILGLFLVPGILYLVFASQLRAYKTWSAIVLLVMASGQSLFVGIALASAVLRMVVSGRIAGNGVVLIFFALFLAAGILLIVYLCQSFTALRLYHGRTVGHAFQPIMPPGMPQGAPVLPYTEYSSAEPPPYPQTGTTPPTPRDQA